MNSEKRFGWSLVIAAFVVGLLVGWFAIGWGVWPVEWKSTDPVDLRQEERDEYLVMVANDYAATRDAALALRRLGSWPSLAEADREIRELAGHQAVQGQGDLAQRLRTLADGLPLPSGEPLAQPDQGLDLAKIIQAAVIAATVIGLVALALYLLRRRGRSAPQDRLRERLRETQGIMKTAPPAIIERVAEKETEEEPSLPERREGIMPRMFRRAETESPPSWGFEATYEGEGMEFDRTFTLDSPGGEYSGECGVGAATHLGENVEQINALEVWLFDKSDIRTVAKVLMSERAYHDDAMKEELSTRGDPVLATAGTTFSLVGNSIRTDVVVDEVEYLRGGLPNSAFARVSLRLHARKRRSSGQR
jgi:hypothetical protein